MFFIVFFCGPFVLGGSSPCSPCLLPYENASHLTQIRDLILKLDHVARQNDVVHFPRLALAAKGGSVGWMGWVEAIVVAVVVAVVVVFVVC